MKTFAELSMDFLFDTSFYCRFCNFIIIKGAGDFSSVSNFIEFPHGNFIKNCLWTSIGSACYYALCHDTGSACCFGEMNKWILSCMVSLFKNDAGVAAHFDRKILKKFLQIGGNFAYLLCRIIFRAYEIKVCLKTEYCNMHTGREDMCSHNVGAP